MKRQLTGGSQLYPGAHTPFTPQGGGKRGKDERENTTPSSGREECRKAGGGLLSFGLGVNSQPQIPEERVSSGPAKKDSRVPGKCTR